jgi:Domain of unknown function (DUF5615)
MNGNARAWRRIPPLSPADARATDRLLRRRAKFLVDHNIGKLAEILREAGWNAISADDGNLSTHADEDIFACGWREKRIIITSDTDFLDDERFPFHRCPGVVVVPNPSTGMASFAEAVSNTVIHIGRYAGAFNREKTVIHQDGTWLVRGFSKERGVHWESQFKVDERGHAWELV